MIEKFSHNSIKLIMQAQDYRGFIESWIQEKNRIKKFGFSDIARFGKFSSRSFPRDVVKGSKRITPSSLYQFIKGLGLDLEWGDYFRILVEIEEPKCRTKITDIARLLKIKNTLKQRILRRFKSEIINADKAFELLSLPKVYAALGTIELGASLGEISERTNITKVDLQPILKFAVDSGIAQKKGTRFFALESHLSFEGLRASGFFKKQYLWTCKKLIEDAEKNFDSRNNLFFSSAFSISKSDLKKLSEELHEVLLKYVDSSEDSNGDQVVQLVAGFF